MAVIDHEKRKAKKVVHIKSKSRVKVVGTAGKSRMVTGLRIRLKMKQADFARLVPVSVRSLATLESGVPPNEGVARRLIELRRLINALSEVIKADSLGTWFDTPNDAFDGLKPREVIDRGESDRLWSMIYFLRSGVPS